MTLFQPLQQEFVDNTKILATKEDLANNKAEIIKWMFIFWIGQLAVTFGFIPLFFKKQPSYYEAR